MSQKQKQKMMVASPAILANERHDNDMVLVVDRLRTCDTSTIQSM